MLTKFIYPLYIFLLKNLHAYLLLKIDAYASIKQLEACCHLG